MHLVDRERLGISWDLLLNRLTVDYTLALAIYLFMLLELAMLHRAGIHDWGWTFVLILLDSFLRLLDWIRPLYGLFSDGLDSDVQNSQWVSDNSQWVSDNSQWVSDNSRFGSSTVSWTLGHLGTWS